ncbi:hypothetical protein COLO4_24541 [Corchorus olitorius]|uniref:Uncharacterized protein n=1 Tax=Corchorus olitorius TaxID=93759 RepID=A0A1R3I973_9ROSI|nr:hypothetical protein COLO4_24541 [Corchorus olitorius]
MARLPLRSRRSAQPSQTAGRRGFPKTTGEYERPPEILPQS